MRRVVVALLFVAGCAKGLGPTDVELTINTSAAAVTDADVATVRALELTLSGVQNDHTRYDLSRALSRQEKILVHLTQSTGELTIAALARDAGGLVVAIGSMKTPLKSGGPQIVTISLEPPPDGPHAMSAISLTPDHAELFGGQTLAMSSPSAVTWSVAGGGAGGTIDDAGLYTAPASAGSDSIVVDSTVYFGEQRTVPVTILKTGVVRYAGLPAGAGTVDGIGHAARVAYPRGLALDGAGSAYFSDDSNVVRKLDIASGAVTTIAGSVENSMFADGTGAAAGLVNPWNVAWDGARGVLYIGDNNIVRKMVVATGVVTTLAGASNMWGSTDGTGSAATFQNAFGLAYDNQNHLYVADPGASNVRVVDVTTGAVTTLAGVPFMNGFNDGDGATAKFDWPVAVVLDGQGGLFVGDSHNSLIRRVDLGTKIVSTVAGKLGVGGFTDGPKGMATINYPEQLAYDGAGTLYAAGRKIDVASGSITTIVKGNWNPIDTLTMAADGTLWAASDTAIATVDKSNFQLTTVAGVSVSNADTDRLDGSRWVAHFNQPTGVASTADGTLFVRDGSSIRRVDLVAGTVKQVFVNSVWMGDGNISTAPDGTIYLPYNNAIWSLLPAEGYSTVHQVAGTGVFGYADGPSAQAKFSCPNDVAVVGQTLYVADGCDNVIRAVDLAGGMVSTLAGTANMGGLVDMPGAAARFNGPQAIVADGAGNLYVASNNAVRKIVIAGAIVSTVAGGDAPGFADGSGSAAKFSAPVRLALDSSKQNLYVADRKNTAIRKVTLGGTVTTVAGAPGKAVVTTGALPASINEPNALAFTPTGDLFVVVRREQALLQIRLP